MSSTDPAHSPPADHPPADHPPADHPPAGEVSEATAYDPLRLCIFATIALLGWLGGPWILAVFAALGFAGYWKARRGGLLTSRCLLRDTRLVLTYLAALFVTAGYGVWRVLMP